MANTPGLPGVASGSYTNLTWPNLWGVPNGCMATQGAWWMAASSGSAGAQELSRLAP